MCIDASLLEIKIILPASFKLKAMIGQTQLLCNRLLHDTHLISRNCKFRRCAKQLLAFSVFCNLHEYIIYCYILRNLFVSTTNCITVDNGVNSAFSIHGLDIPIVKFHYSNCSNIKIIAKLL